MKLRLLALGMLLMVALSLSVRPALADTETIDSGPGIQTDVMVSCQGKTACGGEELWIRWQPGGVTVTALGSAHDIDIDKSTGEAVEDKLNGFICWGGQDLVLMNGSEESFVHTYPAPGNYTIGVVACDYVGGNNDGEESGEGSGRSVVVHIYDYRTDLSVEGHGGEVLIKTVFQGINLPYWRLTSPADGQWPVMIEEKSNAHAPVIVRPGQTPNGGSYGPAWLLKTNLEGITEEEKNDDVPRYWTETRWYVWDTTSALEESHNGDWRITLRGTLFGDRPFEQWVDWSIQNLLVNDTGKTRLLTWDPDFPPVDKDKPEFDGVIPIYYAFEDGGDPHTTAVTVVNGGMKMYQFRRFENVPPAAV